MGGCHRPASESASPEAGVAGPSLFFSSGELEQLREKVKREPAASMYAKLLERAEATLAVSEKPVVLKTGIDGRVWATRVIDTAFAAHLTGRDDLMQAAIRMLCSEAEQYSPDDYFALNRDLFVGNMAEGMAIGYDLVRGQLTPQQNALLRNHIEEIGAFIYSASTTGKAGNTDTYHWIGEEREARFATNWNTVSHGNMGLCALVLDAHPEWIELANKRILGYLKHSNDATGAPYEGSAYLGYGKQNAIGYIVALNRLQGIDLLDSPEAGHLNEISSWMVHHIYPWGGGLVPINQSGDVLSQSDWFLYLCNRYQDRVGQWAFLRLFGEKERFGGDVSEPFLLIEDSYTKKNDAPGDFVWQMFTAKGNKAKLLPAEKAVVITGANGKGVCKVTCLGPEDAVWSIEEKDGQPLLRLQASTGRFRIQLEASEVAR